MSLRQRLLDLDLDHREIESGQSSPYLSEMEGYYFRHPVNFRGKVMLAAWIPRDVRQHMIDHVNSRFARPRPRRKVQRLAGLRRILLDPNVRNVEGPRVSYVKDSKGRVHKIETKSGRYAHYTSQERREVDRVRQQENKP